MRLFLIISALVLFALPAHAQTIAGCGTVAIAKADASSATKLATQADCFGKAKVIADTAEAQRRERIKAIGVKAPATPAPAPSPASTVRRIGMNASAPVYYGTERAWANLAYRASEWMNPVGALNDQRNPSISGRLFLIAPNAVMAGKDTRVNCSWTGGGKVSLMGGAPVYGDHTASATWAAQGAPNGFGSMIIDLSGSDGTFRNLDCREAGVVTNGRLDQRYVDDMKVFSTIRFLDWSQANSNKPITWATRSLPGQQVGTVFNQDQPIEDQIEIANAAGADAWFTIPWNTDPAYVRGMATLIRDTLKGKAYFETGNEVWNWAFPVTTQALNEGIERNLTPDKWNNVFYRYAEKTIENNKIITDVFKAQPARLVRVASFQSGQVWAMDLFMGFRDAAQWVDVIADAPYFGLDSLNSDTPVQATQAELFAQLEAIRLQSIQNTTAMADAAKRYGKLSMIYEGGQSTTSPAANEAVNIAMQNSPLMGAAYDRYLADLKRIHTGPIMLFDSTGRTSKWGSFGHHDYTGQPLAESPKRRAAVEANAKP